MEKGTKNKRELFFILVGVAFLLFALFSTGFFRNLGKQAGEEFYVNAKGEKWTLPTEGTYEFTASSGAYPKILSGKIDPLKVKVGDTQTMTIRVASPVPMKSVAAFIETDTKTQEISLALVENKALSGDYFKSQPYLINDKDELIINKAGSSYAEKAMKQLVASAEAQSLVEYTFEGNWIVNDTHTKTYHTKFVAEDEKGNEAQVTLLWSDPNCNFNPDGVLLGGGCAFDNGIEGFDGGNVTIPDGATVGVNGSGTFVWNGNVDNSNRSLFIETGGMILIQTGVTAQVKEGGLFFDVDSDGDTWPTDLALRYGTGETCDGCIAPIRVKLSPARQWNYPPGAGIDCADNVAETPEAADVHPQMPSEQKFFRSQINGAPPNGLAWDYDCSSDETGGWGDNVGTPPWVSNAYNIVSGGDDQGGTLSCVTGQEVVSSTFSGLGYCGSAPPNAYDTLSCNPPYRLPPTGSGEVIPKGLEDGFTFNDCDGCIGLSLFGYCH